MTVYSGAVEYACRQRKPGSMGHMIEVSAEITAKPADVMKVLQDGWLYSGWFVGAIRPHAVDPEWPQPGAMVHHAVGVWPVMLRGCTEVRAYDPEGHLDLLAGGWPVGSAVVKIAVRGSGTGSRIDLGKEIISGPGRLMGRTLDRLLTEPRNRKSLQRLVAYAEGWARFQV